MIWQVFRRACISQIFWISGKLLVFCEYLRALVIRATFHIHLPRQKAPKNSRIRAGWNQRKFRKQWCLCGAVVSAMQIVGHEDVFLTDLSPIGNMLIRRGIW